MEAQAILRKLGWFSQNGGPLLGGLERETNLVPYFEKTVKCNRALARTGDTLGHSPEILSSGLATREFGIQTCCFNYSTRGIKVSLGSSSNRTAKGNDFDDAKIAGPDI